MLLIQSSDLSHVFGCDLEQSQTEVIRSGKGPHYLQYSVHNIRTHSLMIYSDFIASNLVKNSLIALYFIHLQNKKGDLVFAGQYMNYQSFKGLQLIKTVRKLFPYF